MNQPWIYMCSPSRSPLPRSTFNVSSNSCFPGGSDGKASAYNAGDWGSISGSGRSPGEGNGNPLQYSYLENPMDGGACRLQSMGSQRVGYNWVTSLFFLTPIKRYLLSRLCESHKAARLRWTTQRCRSLSPLFGSWLCSSVLAEKKDIAGSYWITWCFVTNEGMLLTTCCGRRRLQVEVGFWRRPWEISRISTGRERGRSGGWKADKEERVVVVWTGKEHWSGKKNVWVQGWVIWTLCTSWLYVH